MRQPNPSSRLRAPGIRSSAGVGRPMARRPSEPSPSSIRVIDDQLPSPALNWRPSSPVAASRAANSR